MVDEKVEALGQLVGDASIPEQIQAAMDELHVVAKTGSWNDLEDRTHGDIIETVTWDGNIEGTENVDGVLYYVSDVVPTYDQIYGQEFVIKYYNGVTLTGQIGKGQHYLSPIDSLGSYQISDFIVITAVDNVSFSSRTYSKKGIYFMHVSPEDGYYLYVASMNYVNVKQLDEKFIPDTIARKEDIVQSDWNENDETALSYVKNRTHWIGEPVEYTYDGNYENYEKVVSPINSNVFYVKVSDTPLSALELIDSTITLINGEKETEIKIDEYGVYASPDGSAITILQDYAFSIFDATKTGFPSEGLYFTHSLITGFRVSAMKVPVIQQLDEKFIPSTIARADDLPIAITPDRIDEICGIEPVMTLVVDEDGDAVINAGFPDDEGNLTI
jgi:hypothetical protein